MRLSSLVTCSAFLFLFFGSLDTAQGAEKRILVIESYHKEMFWDSGYRQGILNVLGKKASIDFFEMNTKRIPRSEFATQAKAAVAAIDRLQPDLVMLGDDNALNFVGKDVLKRNIPLVFLGINGNPRDYFGGKIPAGMTGVLERPLLKRYLRLIREINPDWEKVLVLFDDSNTSRIYKNDPFFFGGESHVKILGLQVEIHLTNSYEQLQAKVREAQTAHQVLFMGGLNTLTNANKQHVSADTATSWIYRHSDIPLFGFWRGTVGPGEAIGGYVIDGQSMGNQAARLAAKILTGTRPKDLSIEQLNEGRLILSGSGLKHWNITIPQYLRDITEFID